MTLYRLYILERLLEKNYDVYDVNTVLPQKQLMLVEYNHLDL
jgi:hypothetical protein